MSFSAIHPGRCCASAFQCVTGSISKFTGMCGGALQTVVSKVGNIAGTIFSAIRSAGPAIKNGFVHSVAFIGNHSANAMQSLKSFTKTHPKLAAVVTVATLIGSAVATLLLCCHKEPAPPQNDGSSSPRR